jgi:hypothetical protein
VSATKVSSVSDSVTASAIIIKKVSATKVTSNSACASVRLHHFEEILSREKWFQLRLPVAGSLHKKGKKMTSSSIFLFSESGSGQKCLALTRDQEQL